MSPHVHPFIPNSIFNKRYHYVFIYKESSLFSMGDPYIF